MSTEKITNSPSAYSSLQTMWNVAVGEDTVSAVYEPATSKERAVFVCAHGAGGNMSDRGILSVSSELRRRGIGTVRFNFVYREMGSGRPDPMPRLKECVAAVVAHVRSELNPRILITGGRSMGGRAASMLAADQFESEGLLLLAYPLHPAGQPAKLRDAHLPQITVPVLCINGTRDALCNKTLMERALTTVTTDWTMHWLDGADHSFHVLKSSGRNDAQVLAEAGAAASSWVEQTVIHPT
ncbi:MAG: dienelactone hydrolase family protein [Gemmatimonadaceae bacterium]|nr:dienelactone hydrolase family protein [Gemmatimonadaceae bacterium]